MNKFGISHNKLKKIFRVIGVISIVLSIVFIFLLIGKLDIFNNPDALSELIKHHILLGSIIFFFLQIIQVIIPIIPGGVTTVVGFLTFGPLLGFVLNFLGIIIGSSLLFALVRKYGRPFILLFLNEDKIVKYEEKISSKTYETIFILNMVSPMAPADIMIMITGLSKISFKKFLIIIMICRPISMITYSYFWIYGGEVVKNFLN
ncbi:TVP38/TMEM64 family protein [Streptococcus parauberis]|uniref:TVP38/TMEM64 family protein n=1 Tax=Streptococcus parauberis TaxID=1348 RepID=UPI000CCDDF1E|nr:VTT domain-containing protein [Streptococcus parauberis]PNY19310.1 TVP38/TMEM64 family inner membrane protein YdjZ [Streptococcus parauberis]